jgi:hypothetical protein
MNKSYCLAIFLSCLFINSSAQRYQLEFSGGISNYQGDLQPHIFTFKQSRPAGGIFIKYQVNGHFIGRAGLSVGSLYADDKFNRNYLKSRNLNFRSKLIEAQVGLECYLINIEEHKLSPYIILGIAGYHFNSYTYDQQNNKIYLNPLSTEGEGFPEYPERKKYKLTQLAIPFGEGILYRVNCNVNLSAEFTQRKLFTDYLDDVSTTFIDQDVLFKQKGQKAVDIAYRSDELPGGAPYPRGGVGRGNVKQNDWYYMATIKLSLGLFNCNTGNFILSGIFPRSGGSRGVGCPRQF